jgi:PEGA domain
MAPRSVVRRLLHYPYPPYAYRAYPRAASLRVQVEPAQTEVFVDGYFAGPADEFDGVFQRLRLESGEHEIELYLPGYRSVKQKVYLQPDTTFRIRQEMEALGPGDVQEPRPMAPTAAPGAAGPNIGSDFGAVSVRVQPIDAEVVVDGERWESSGSGNRLTLQLPAGPHRIEVRKPGFDTYTSVVDVRPGETVTLNVSLTGQ